jgi:hypothetical protein
MLKIRQILFIVLLLPALFNACYRDITLDLQEPDIRPAVFGMARAGKPIELIVLKSYPLLTFTDTLNKYIFTNISLLVNDEFKEILYLKNNRYYSNYIPQPADKLKISFEWEGKEISAEETVPAQVKIDSVCYVKDNSDTKSFYLYFKDFAENQDYYAVSALVKHKFNDDYLLNYTWIISKSPLIGNEEDMSDYYYYESLMFSDTLFNGKEVALLIDISKTISGIEELTLSLERVDKDYYKYANSVLKNDRAQTPDLFLGDAEYINVHSNIKNGYGIFKAFTINSKDITEYFR